MIRFEGEFCVDKEVFWVKVSSWEYMETFSGDCDSMLKFSEKTFSFSLLKFLASQDFVDRLGFQNFRNLEIMFLVSKFEPDWFKCKPLRPKCLLVIFLLSRVSIFKFSRWLVNCLTVSAALPLSDLKIIFIYYFICYYLFNVDICYI